MATLIALGAECSRASGYSARDPRADGKYDEVLPALLHILDIYFRNLLRIMSQI
jgi:hypothetical protein